VYNDLSTLLHSEVEANYPLKYAGNGKLLFIKGTSLVGPESVRLVQWLIGDAQIYIYIHIYIRFVCERYSKLKVFKIFSFWFEQCMGLLTVKSWRTWDSVHHERRTSTPNMAQSVATSLVLLPRGYAYCVKSPWFSMRKKHDVNRLLHECMVR
jgi:hypothetical protein